MPTFDGATGRVYYKAWRGPGPRSAAVVFQHGFGEHSGLYHRLGNTLNASGIELWALDEIGHGLTEGDRAVIPVAHAREWAGRLRRARLAEFAGSRHDILNEAVHREVAAAITEFILTGGGEPGDA